MIGRTERKRNNVTFPTFMTPPGRLGQGLMQLERCEFEDASASLEGEHSAAVEVIFPGFSEFFSWLRRCFFLIFF